MTNTPRAGDLESWRAYQDMPLVEAKPKVILYDAKGRPLTQPVGFQPSRLRLRAPDA